MSDAASMRRALELAGRGLGRTAPNPAVGAVIVRDGCVVGEGWPRAAGQPHAEAEALTAAGKAARGATIYVTLEPCCHFGRTPPCTEAIIDAGVSRVVYACPDPDPRCAGQGEARLRAAGVSVCRGPLEDEALRLNEGYLKHKRTGLPFLTLKLALTLDGKIATRTGDSRWVTGEAAREYVHRLRDRSDAVMVGIGTVLQDDPALTTRLPEGGRDAARVVVDTDGRTPVNARLLDPVGGARCIIATAAAVDAARAERVAALKAVGAEVLALSQDAGRVDLTALLRALGERSIMTVLCEGGAHLAGGLLRARLVDRLVLMYAPKLLGDAQALGAVVGLEIAQMAEALRLQVECVGRLGEDLMVSVIPCSQD
jgi:diaminohydroxyphosphoribosylaminopyrimidine deaminase / 5-amino-6-(5-phosphoribosylamino)uracil reductase